MGRVHEPAWEPTRRDAGPADVTGIVLSWAARASAAGCALESSPRAAGRSWRPSSAAGLDVCVVVADRPCRALEVAAEAGVPAELLLRDGYGAGFDRHAYTRRLVKILESYGVDVVAMAGFGTIFSPEIFSAFPGRVLNTHPALLPAFKGWHAVRDALAAGVNVTGHDRPLGDRGWWTTGPSWLKRKCPYSRATPNRPCTKGSRPSSGGSTRKPSDVSWLSFARAGPRRQRHQEAPA